MIWFLYIIAAIVFFVIIITFKAIWIMLGLATCMLIAIGSSFRKFIK